VRNINRLVHIVVLTNQTQEREREVGRERDAAFAKIAELKSTISLKELEMESVKQKMNALETKLERSRTVIDSQQKQLNKNPGLMFYLVFVFCF
jgi:chromosome segregation ATPase